MTLLLVVIALAAVAAVPWALMVRSPHGDEGTLDEWMRLNR